MTTLPKSIDNHANLIEVILFYNTLDSPEPLIDHPKLIVVTAIHCHLECLPLNLPILGNRKVSFNKTDDSINLLNNPIDYTLLLRNLTTKLN
jgi:hypothetical protein